MEFQLFLNVIKLSESKEWSIAKTEWNCISIRKDVGRCACGKYPISEICEMQNNLNGNKIIVGNCCVNKFFNDTQNNSAFKAISKSKINKRLIEIAFQNGIINETERDFTNKVWRKRKLSDKQFTWLNSIKSRILESVTNGKTKL